MNKPVNRAYADLEEHWGIDTTDLTQNQHNVLAHQQAFLEAYAECGNMAGAAVSCDMNRGNGYRYRDQNQFRFKERLLEAHAYYCDKLEGKASELAFALEPGQNFMALMALLNANLPDKYRPNSVAPSETLTETLSAMKQAVREHRKLRDGSEVETVTETVIVKKGLQMPRTEE